MEYKFYYPDGKKCESIEKFLEFYSKAYYIQNNVYVEDCVLKIADKELQKLSKKDIFLILAWKLGKINYLTTTEKKVNYYKGWDENKLCAQIRKDQNIDISEVYRKISEITDKKSLEEYLRKLKEIDGLGNTTVIALAFFASNRQVMLYDRFAARAVAAIDGGVKPFNNIPVKIPDISYISIERCKEIHEAYTNKVNTIFCEFNNDRRIDQALWVYGHMFKKP